MKELIVERQKRKKKSYSPSTLSIDRIWISYSAFINIKFRVMFILFFVLLFFFLSSISFHFISFNSERSKAFINCLLKGRGEGRKGKLWKKKKKERKGNKGNRLLCVALPAYIRGLHSYVIICNTWTRDELDEKFVS